MAMDHVQLEIQANHAAVYTTESTACCVTHCNSTEVGTQLLKQPVCSTQNNLEH